MKRICYSCKVEKQISEFRRDRTRKGGHSYRCKTCHSQYNAERYRKNRKEIRKKASAYAKKYVKKRRADDPDYKLKSNAMTAVYANIKSGKLKKGNCTDCGSRKNIEAHHEDYSKPLEVVWLCRSCHQILHWAKRKGHIAG